MAHQDSSGIVSFPLQENQQQQQQQPLIASSSSNDKKIATSVSAEETQNDKIISESGFSPSASHAKASEDGHSIGQDKGRCIVEDSGLENVLEVKKKRLLEELESVLLPKDEFSSAMVEKTTAQMVQAQQQQQDYVPIRPSLGIEVIDDTALVETLPIPVAASGNGVPKKTSKKDHGVKEVDGKNGKQSRRRANKAAVKMGGSGSGGRRSVSVTGIGMDHEAQNGNGNGMKRKYSRKEMEALRFVNMVEQRKFWKAIYSGLDTAVAKEYNDLASADHQNQKHIRLDYDPRQCYAKKKEAPAILSAACCEKMDNELQVMESCENMSPVDPSCSDGVTGGYGCSIVEVCSEDGDSEDDYASIQRPAFLVEGEPNFDSGPPEDGWEYLRRVRWEADQIPKVKVAKLDRSKLNNEQSVYMPKIPDIAKCPEHLLPLKQWEDVFLAEFSALRANLSCLEGSNAIYSGNLQPFCSSQLPVNFGDVMNKGVLLDNHLNIGKAIDQPTILTAEDKDITLPLENPKPRTTIDQTTSRSPTPPLLSAIFGMDSVARVSMLQKQIGLLEPVNTISRNECMWLFALCATVDAPLDADTCAALRSLLRKCASIRATKAELDEEVVMLNILATISGRYFGQSEN